MKIRNLVFVTFLVCSFLSSSFGKEIAFYGGEYTVPDYYGPQDVTYKLKKSVGSIVPNDKRDIYFQELTEKDIFHLMEFWEEDLSSSANCSNAELTKNYKYIRYLYRLLTISYLFESLKKYDYYANLLGFNLKECGLKYKEVFQGCSPRTLEMKKFIDRAQHRYNKNFDFSNYKTLSNSEQKNWLRTFFENKEPNFLYNQTHYFCRDKLSQNQCGYLVKNDMAKVMGYLCQRDKKLITSICSETDEVYGISYSEQAMNLIGHSNAFKVINKAGKGYSCLERYARIHQGRESKRYYLKEIFQDIFSQQIANKSKYLQGQLFLPGALKEFDEKGLTSFLFVPEKPLVIPKIKKYVEEPVYVAAVPKPTPPPPPKPKPKKIKKVAVAKPKPKVKKKSAFLKATEVLLSKRLAKVDVDMNELEKDYIFTDQMVANLREPMADYQTRSGLQEMVAYDKMGSNENPIQLLFLKYLIDTESHQGLYNIQSVLGNFFYVENDIDRKKGPVFIQLKLDASTSFQWQITVVDKQKFESEMNQTESGGLE